MSRGRVGVPSDVKRMLDESGVPWRAENGRHLKIFVRERLVQTFPADGGDGRSGRAWRNARAQIRRALGVAS